MHRAAMCVATALLALGLARANFARQEKHAVGSQSKQSPEAREIFKQLIEINTTDSVGSVTAAAEAMAKRFRDAGFYDKDVILAGPNERKKNLVVRFHGSGARKPVLFIGHLDVVEARREDWTTDPFQFVEKDGYFYGRGAEDMKDGDAFLVANFIRLKREGFVPDRDLILALTADEEGGDYNGVDWLVKEHRDWIDAEYCINLDGGEFIQKGGKKLQVDIQTSEKVYADFQFESLNPGGHSSVPSPDNAIYHLSGALLRLRDFSFPTRMDDTTRNFFQAISNQMSGQVAADLKAITKEPPDEAALHRISQDPYLNTLLRTTCVATMLTGGHAPNALPQMARANVNCRIFPGDDPEEVRKTLERVAADPKVAVTVVPEKTADGKSIPTVAVPASKVAPELNAAMRKTVDSLYGPLPVVLEMSAGATDGKFLRIAGIPTYGIGCVFFEMDDSRAHGKDERVGVKAFDEGVEFNYQLIRALSSGK